MTEIGKAIERIRKFFASRPNAGMTLFARRADLHRNTLYGYHAAGWNPTRETLEKCLRTIDEIEAEEKANKSRPKSSAQRAQPAAA